VNGEQEREPSEGVRISDKRRIDPVTFQARQPEAPTGTPPPVPGEASLEPPTLAAEQVALEQANARAEEALADVKRIAAEYANYRRRVDRDRDVQRDLAVGSVVTDLLPILDDIGRARSHDELTGGFKSVGEAVEAVTAKYGLETFGEPGETFDPNVHEAMSKEHSDEVAGPTVSAVYSVGYRLRGRVLRPALVAVADNE
jgi:molecular chaperone GrpE